MTYNKLVIATHNAGKIVELEKLFAEIPGNNIPEILSAASLGLSEPVEDGESFEDNALIKAKYVAEKSNLPALADDSGLVIYGLDGQPGIHSATLAEDFATPELKRNFPAAQKYLLDALANRGFLRLSDRGAKFVCCLCLYVPNKEPKFFRGEVYGNISLEPKGENGFGYDPIFIPLGENRTFGQMSKQEKCSFNTHRAIAMGKFIEYFESFIRCN